MRSRDAEEGADAAGSVEASVKRTSRVGVGSGGHGWNAGFPDLSRIFAPFATLDHGFGRLAAWPGLAEFNALARRRDLRNAAGLPLTFVQAAPKRRRARRPLDAAAMPSYEQQILSRGEVPTRRESWHDFFNMLVWNLLPRAKAALNERQVAQADGSKERTREQDRLAMFDEGGAIAVVPPGRLPDGRDANQPAPPPWLVVAGHAVYEAVVKENDDIRLLTCFLAKEPAFFAKTLAEQLAEVDADVAQAIRAGAFAFDGPTRFAGILLKDLP